MRVERAGMVEAVMKAMGTMRALVRLGAMAASLIAVACGDAGGDEAVGPGGPGSAAKVSEIAVSDPIATAILADPEYAQVPGFRTHRSCVHHVQEGESIERQSDGVIVIKRDGRVVATRPGCSRPPLDMRRATRLDDTARSLGNAGGPPPLPSGWIAWSYAVPIDNNGRNWFSRITGTWTVPNNPLQNGGLVYFFNDLTSRTNPAEILQPVLQWGQNAWFGSNGWWLASWWVDALGNAAHSTPISMLPGQGVEGHVYRTKGTCNVLGVCDWSVRAVSSSLQATTLTFNTTNVSFTLAHQGVLEAYNVWMCDQLPNSPSVTFANTLLYQPWATGDVNNITDVYPNVLWSQSVPAGRTPACGYTVTNQPRGTRITF